jgi:hypothetical protein
MSYFCKIKMSGFLTVGVRFSLAKENLHGKGHFEDESERGGSINDTSGSA